MEENPDSVTHCWMRDEPPRALDFASLTGLCDAFYPRMYLRRAKWVPIGTVSLNVYFHIAAADLATQGDGPLLGAARGQVFHGGFFDQEGQVWDAHGRLLATTHQMVWFKE